MVPEAVAWLESRHQVATRPELAEDSRALRSAMYKVRGVVLPRKLVITQEFLDFSPKLKVVARMHAGTDNTDLEACRERGVKVIQALTANVRSNAEYLLGALLMLYRRGMFDALAGQRHASVHLGRELYGSVVGILGLGPTAHALAQMLAQLGVRLIGYDPAVHHTAPVWDKLRIQPVGLADLMAQSDAVSAQIMYASRYRHFINAKVLAACKPGQVWVGSSRSALFEPEGLAAATPELLKKRAAALLLRNGLIVAAVGDIGEAELARQLDRSFGLLPAGTPPALPAQWEPPTKPRVVVVERPVPQSSALMALPGIARDDPDWYAALVMNHVLGGGGQQSRLFNEVREKRGLAYSVSSGLRTYKRAALLVMSTGSANERVAEALKVIRAEMARMRTDGVTEAELNDAKTYLTGALALSLDSSGSIAGLLHSMQIDGLSPDHLTRRASLIAAVKLADVRKVAQRLLRDETLTTVVVGKPVGVTPEP